MNLTKFIAVVLFAIMALGASTASAQNYTNDTENTQQLHSKAQVTFFPPIGSNGRRGHLYTNDFSFNILAGVSAGERAFAFAGITNVINGDAEGFQFAGLVNYTGGRGRAFQFAGLTNIVRGEMEGFQFGGLLNTSADLKGFQIGGLANVADDLQGLQIGGLANIARGVEGIQYSGLTNVSHDIKGFQFAGLANIARDVEGLQFGGLFNVAKRVRGVQFAGLVNVAEASDYPIGLVNIIREGEMGIGLGYNEIGTTSLIFRSGGRVLYGIIGLGYNHKMGKDHETASLIGGYGAHINILPWLRINNELTVESVIIAGDGDNAFKSGYALLPAFRFGWFEVFGGPSINYMQSHNGEMHDLFPKNPLWSEQHHRSNKLQSVFVGWQVGVQFIIK